MYINFVCPPMPHLIVGGVSIFRKGDRHERRMIHNTFDIVYVRKGTIYLEEDSIQYELKRGQFIILSPDTSHGGYRYCSEDTVFSWIHFYTTGEFFYSKTPEHYVQSKINKNKYYQKDSFNISLPKSGTIHQRYQKDMEYYLEQISQVKIDRYNHQKLFYNSAVSQIEYQRLFLEIIKIICELSEKTKEKDLAEEIYNYFQNCYQDPFDLTELSHKYSFHPVYIIRCIKKKYGMTPLQLLISIRMEEAKKLLVTTNLNVNIIAQNVGFYDAAYFSKQFKKSTGMTALNYRKNESVK